MGDMHVMRNNQDLEKEWLGLKNNCDYFFSRIISYPLCPPEHVYFALTSRCNLRCKMCSVSSSPMDEKDELTTAQCHTIIEQIADLKIRHLIFSGGEPFLRKDIFDLIAYAVGKGITMVDVITNGLLVNEKIARELAKVNLSHITVSIDGLEQRDDSIRGKGSFRGAARAIDYINKYKKENRPTIGINFTIMDCNIDDILPMIDLAIEKKCSIIVLQPMLSDNTDMHERRKNDLWVSEDNIPRLREVMGRVSELKRSLRNISIHVSEKILEMIPSYFAGLPINRDLKCYEGIVRISISPNGDLWTCRGIYGNLKKSPLKDCWFSPQAKEIRREVRQCQEHCLQSCIHLAELSNIYDEIIKFKLLADKQKNDGKYLDNLSALLKKYILYINKRGSIESLLRKMEDNTDNLIPGINKR